MLGRIVHELVREYLSVPWVRRRVRTVAHGFNKLSQRSARTALGSECSECNEIQRLKLLGVCTRKASAKTAKRLRRLVGGMLVAGGGRAWDRMEGRDLAAW